MTTAAAPLAADRWQSILFVPVLRDRYIEKACTSAAHAVQLDLEDSVPAADKDKARAALGAAVRTLRSAGKPVSVRVNQPMELAAADIAAAVEAGVDVLMLPKVLGPAHIQLVDELAGRLEARTGAAPGATRFIAALETPRAYLQAEAIALSSPRLLGMMLGGEDFAKECGCEPEEGAMRGFKLNVLAAARAAGIRPMGALGSIADFRDLDAYESMLRRSRACGFEGITCIHPAQAERINKVYAPDEDTLAWARKVVEMSERASAAGVGAFELHGRMIDAPIVARARRMLDSLP